MNAAEAWRHVELSCRPAEKITSRPFIPNLRLLGHFDRLLGSDLLDHAMNDALDPWDDIVVGGTR